MFYNKIKSKTETFIKKYLFLFGIILISSVIALLLNILVDPRTAFLSGESQFSFDYSGHVSNIISYFIRNKEGFLGLNACNSCPGFYAYSRWVALMTFMVVDIGEILRIHHFIFQMYLVILMQILSLYFFIKVFLEEKVNKQSFIIAATVFIILPVNLLYVGQFLFLIWYSLLLFSLSLSKYVLERVYSASAKKCTVYGLLLGLLFSTWFNIGIGFLPIIFYTIIIFGLYFHKKIIGNFKKLFPVFLLAFLMIVILNLPFLVSVFLRGNSRDFIGAGYNILNFTEAITGRFYIDLAGIVNAGKLEILLFFGTVLFLFTRAKLTRQKKIFLVFVYLFITVEMMGGPLTDLIFYHFPLMSSIRDLQRFSFIQHIVIFIFIYLGLTSLLRKPTRGINKLVIIICALILILIPIKFIFLNAANIVHVVTIPQEYFAVDKYLANNNQPKIYFPLYLPYGETMLGNYKWASAIPENPFFRFRNPFLTLFALRDLVDVDSFPVNNYSEETKQNEIRELLDYSNPPNKIIEYLGLNNFSYLIVDRNFLWNRIFPHFDINNLTKNLQMDRRFGNIFIYKIKDKNVICKKSYGDYLNGYCNINNIGVPDYLINISLYDYVLDRYVIGQSAYDMTKIINPGNHDHLASPYIQKVVIQEKNNAIGLMTFDANSNQSERIIYTKKVDKGEYKLIVPIYKANAKETAYLFSYAYLEINVNGRLYKTISPYADKNGMSYEKFDLSFPNNNNTVTLTIKGDVSGYLAMKQPIIVDNNALLNIVSKYTKNFNPKEIWTN